MKITHLHSTLPHTHGKLTPTTHQTLKSDLTDVSSVTWDTHTPATSWTQRLVWGERGDMAGHGTTALSSALCPENKAPGGESGLGKLLSGQ